jgi:multiple sugar transport system ATP-binding protein
MAQVRLEQVTKIFPGGVRAVDAVDLGVADHEFVVLVGPSGCGKSTTLRMIAGLEEVSGGTIRIGDRVVNGVPPKDRDVAMVFQNYALYPHKSVYRNMSFALELRRTPKGEIERRVRDAAKILEIEHLLDRKPKALSGGQKQRVAVGRAIVREPAAFLFDEPLSNLDARLRVTTRAELKRLHQRLRTTTVYVTHDQEEAMTLGDRIVVMRDGKVMQADTPLRTYTHPANRFVAGFIGMPPMNFFDGTLKMVDGRLAFEETVGQGAGFHLPLGPGAREASADRVGQAVVLGVRPEHLHLQPAGGPEDSAPLAVNVDVVELLGKDMDVYARTDLAGTVVARLEARGGMASGSRVTLHVDLDKVYLFEPGESGANLGPGLADSGRRDLTAR